MRRRRDRRSFPTGGTPDLRILLRVVPDLWPKGRLDLRLRVAIALVFLVLAKAASLVMPFFFKDAIDALGEEEQALGAVLALVVAYGTARLMGTVLQQLRDVVFARVSQHALRGLAIRTFEHVHALSLGYHLSRKTGALSRVIDRGVKAIDFLLRFVVFNIVPLLVELAIVAGIFFALFGWPHFAVLVATIVLYIAFTFRVTEWRLKIRMKMNEEDQDAHQKAVDSLLNYETVKYFGAESRETARYDKAMAAYQEAAIRTTTTLGLLNSGQALIIAVGMVTVMALTARDVVTGAATVGDFALVNAYMIQITVPLNFLGTVYREIRQSLVDMREMYALHEERPAVEDAPDARPLAPGPGALRLRDVSFAYEPERVVLKSIDAAVPGGGKLALVGASGAGKSTIGRLLFRFYDVTGGAVEIDGQDVRQVTQESLRAAIGVVPQDTVLFNDTIGYNIAYGQDGAGHEAVERAARAARIHDFIVGLPKGYETVVGERGLKLSGGEKQRVAIARTVLKNPRILILDEATSALDTGTEREIQRELARLGEGRTVVMIAHRLSTVVDADEILVLDDGRVAERGSHAALLARGGVYAGMWAAQEAEARRADAPAAE
ncbi:MAG: ABCB family ABC transporter ATP-binding protein/permease [Paracoccaceae bacterium]